MDNYMQKKRVHLSRIKIDNSDVEEKLRKALDILNWKKIVPSGATVTIKVNATHFEYLPGLTTRLVPQVYEMRIFALKGDKDHIHL